jgi:hypothetical protein
VRLAPATLRHEVALLHGDISQTDLRDALDRCLHHKRVDIKRVDRADHYDRQPGAFDPFFPQASGSYRVESLRSHTAQLSNLN